MKIRLLLLSRPRSDARTIRRVLRAASIDESRIEDLIAGRAAFPMELYAGPDGAEVRDLIRACASAGMQCSTVEGGAKPVPRATAPARAQSAQPSGPPLYEGALRLVGAHRYKLLAGLGVGGAVAGLWAALSGPGERSAGGRATMSEAEFMESAKGRAGDGKMPEFELQGGGSAAPSEIDLGGAPARMSATSAEPRRERTDPMGPLAGGAGGSLGVGIGYRAGRRGARGAMSQRLRVLGVVFGVVMLLAAGVGGLLASGWVPKVELTKRPETPVTPAAPATAPGPSALGEPGDAAPAAGKGVFKQFVARQHQASSCSKSLPPFAELVCKMREIHQSQPEGLPAPPAAGTAAAREGSASASPPPPASAGPSPGAPGSVATAAPPASSAPAPSAPAPSAPASSAPASSAPASSAPASSAPASSAPASSLAAASSAAASPAAASPAAASSAAPASSVPATSAPSAPSATSAPTAPTAPTAGYDPEDGAPTPQHASGAAQTGPPGRVGIRSLDGLTLPPSDPERPLSNAGPYAMFGLVAGLGLGMVLGLFRRGAP